MLKIGCCLNMNARGEKKIGEEALPLLAELGYDYAELPLAQVMDLSDAEFGALLAAVKKTVPVEACNNFFPARVRLTGGNVDFPAVLAYVRAAAARAAALGVKVIVFGSSGAKNIPNGFPYKAALVQLKTLLPEISRIMEPLGITVVMEPLNKTESNFITTAAEGLELVRAVALDNVKLLVDFYHLRMEDEDPAVIIRAGADLGHLHIASKEGRRFPGPGDGEAYDGFFARLKAAAYKGRVSVEGYSGDLSADLKAALKLLRSLW